MSSLQQFFQSIFRRVPDQAVDNISPAVPLAPAPSEVAVDIAADDPLLNYFRDYPSAALVDRIELASPALEQLKQAGIQLIVPLVTQGEVIGLINLGPRLSEQEYSSDDIALLNNLAAQATPAVRVAQLVREQQIEVQERERMEQELQVAHLIQQTLLPKELPELPGWKIDAYYQPARAVGGDFYDFIHFPDGRLGIFVGDVTDKGVPAALVMATTRSILRYAAEKENSPSCVLERANEMLVADIPANMFVTCLYLILDPISGEIVFANAGHNPPYCCAKNQVVELRATGMPLGLMPAMTYEEKRATLSGHQCVLFYSDGLTEAHNPQGEIYGFDRVKNLMGQAKIGPSFIAQVLADLNQFTGGDWEQEDDVSLVTLQRSPSTHHAARGRHILSRFEVASQPGNERIVMHRVAETAQSIGFSGPRVEKIKTAVAEATMNAIEHGNNFRADLPVEIEVLQDEQDFIVVIRDHGAHSPIGPAAEPDLDAKLAGLQSPRGWGLFLIEKMVDALNITTDQNHHTVELVFHRQGEGQ